MPSATPSTSDAKSERLEWRTVLRRWRYSSSPIGTSTTTVDNGGACVSPFQGSLESSYGVSTAPMSTGALRVTS